MISNLCKLMEVRRFKNTKEITDLKALLESERQNGAISGGVFGSVINGKRTEVSDIDVFVNHPSAPYSGEVDYQVGTESGTLFHIFKKRPGLRGGKSTFEVIQDKAETTGRKLFGE